MDSSNNVIHPFPPIQRLSLHGCQTLPPKVYHYLLPQLPQLTHLVPPPPPKLTSGSQFHASRLIRSPKHKPTSPSTPFIPRKLRLHLRKSNPQIPSPPSCLNVH
jgi:hypothetical protein